MWENIDIFGDWSTRFPHKLVARRIFFVGKVSKTAFFSFREITLVETPKFEKFQVVTKFR